jgi:hypothetical protein
MTCTKLRAVVFILHRFRSLEASHPWPIATVPKEAPHSTFYLRRCTEYAVSDENRHGVNTLLPKFPFPLARSGGSLRRLDRLSQRMNTRLDVHKTYKLYIGGNFVRSESGRYLPAQSAQGEGLDNVCHASRKDFRDAVAAARSACGSWSGKNSYLRAQILYRSAEILENRSGELAREIARSTCCPAAKADREVALAIDRLVYFAGWTDKYSQVFGSVNPVASSHFNFTIPEPTGVVVVLAPDTPGLLPLISLVAPVLLSGNTAVVLTSELYPLPGTTFAEILATSDLPGGVVNLLTGRREELASHIAGHMDVNAVVDGSGQGALAAGLQSGTALNLKRYANHSLSPEEWFGPKAEDPYWILDTIEFKTAWHPIGF